MTLGSLTSYSNWKGSAVKPELSGSQYQAQLSMFQFPHPDTNIILPGLHVGWKSKLNGTVVHFSKYMKFNTGYKPMLSSARWPWIGWLEI